jgi:outer membrane biosynthesis protein TonB
MNMDIEDILGDIKASNGKADKPAKAEKAVKADKPAKVVAKPAAKKAAPAKAVKAVAKPAAKKAVAAKPAAKVAPKKAAPAKAVKAPAKAVKAVAKKAAPAKAVKAVAKKAPAKVATIRESEFIVFAEGERAELAKQIKKIVRKEMNSRVLAERLGIHSRKLRRVLYGMNKAGTIKVVPGPSRKLGMYVQPV